MTVDLYPIRYTKKDLGQVPEHERLFHFLAGQLANDISTFNRLTIFSLNGSHGETPSGRANTAVALTMAKQLAARAYEGGMLLKDERFKRVLDDYRPQLSPAAAGALDQLTTYFQGKNLLARIRNEVSAHVDIKTFRSGYVALDPDEELIDYNAEIVGNSLFYSSVLISALALKRVTKKDHVRDAVDAVMLESVRVSGLFMELVNEWMALFVRKHLSHKLEKMLKSKLSLKEERTLSRATIPVFTVGK